MSDSNEYDVKNSNALNYITSCLKSKKFFKGEIESIINLINTVHLICDPETKNEQITNIDPIVCTGFQAINSSVILNLSSIKMDKTTNIPFLHSSFKVMVVSDEDINKMLQNKEPKSLKSSKKQTVIKYRHIPNVDTITHFGDYEQVEIHGEQFYRFYNEDGSPIVTIPIENISDIQTKDIKDW